MNSQKYFNDVSEQWDNMRIEFFGNIVRVKAYEAAKVEKGKVAADIGAGTGFITEGLLEKEIKVIAVDQSEDMINIMKKKFKNNSDVKYILAEGSKLPIDNNSVNYAMANMYLHHVENPSSAIKEMTRIIKPGGTVVITDLDEHNFEFLRTEQFDRWLGFKRDDIKQWFLEAGLKNVVVDCVGGNCSTTSCCESQSASISIFIAYGEK